jgi:hypothetical protein
MLRHATIWWGHIHAHATQGGLEMEHSVETLMNAVYCPRATQMQHAPTIWDHILAAANLAILEMELNVMI